MDYRLEVVRIPVADMDRAKGFYQGLVVDDIDAAWAELSGRGAEVSGVFHLDGARRVPGPAPGRKSFGSYVSFNDWEGNNWLVQEVTTPSRAGRPLCWRHTARWAPWLTRYAVQPQRTTGMRRTSAMMTWTGRIGTRSTWLASPPGRT